MKNKKKIIKRYMPKWDFPPYAFFPGRNIHPNKPGGHMYGISDPQANPIDPSFPDRNEYFCYSIDLYNFGYYWESHVYLEALWNAHNRKGYIADFLKSLIRLAAASIKIEIEQRKSSIGHLERGLELIESIKDHTDNQFLGFNLLELSKNIKSEMKNMKEDNIKNLTINLFPKWD